MAESFVVDWFIVLLDTEWFTLEMFFPNSFCASGESLSFVKVALILADCVEFGDLGNERKEQDEQ